MAVTGIILPAVKFRSRFLAGKKISFVFAVFNHFTTLLIIRSSFIPREEPNAGIFFKNGGMDLNIKRF